MSVQRIDHAELRRLFDRVCDVPPEERHDALIAAGASAESIAEVLELCACDERDPGALQAGIEQQLAAANESGFDAGDRLGAWRLVRRVGMGGMGAVYLVERADGHYEQQAALKMIRGFVEPMLLEHFTRERQILAALHHPYIARLIDGGATQNGQPYLVMDYVEGVPIDAYCKREALDLDALLHLFLQVCDAVQFAHQRLIVHCDLKPANVLVVEDGTPILLDFGIARALSRDATSRSTVGGYLTPGYASPEQMRGESLSAASDVFALGLIFFELVCGRPARRDPSDDTVDRLTEAAIEPSVCADDVVWKPQLAGDIDAIILRATAAAPADRYETVLALAEDIRRHRAHRPVHARPPTIVYRFGRLLRRRWLLFAVSTTVLVVVALSTWRIVVERDRALVAESAAKREAASAGRTRDFLVSVFNVSNPRIGNQKDVLARDVLDEGAARIGTELDAEPKIKAVLVDTLATAYRYIGIPKRSIELLRESVPLYLDPRVDDPLAAAAALSQLSVAYINSSYPKADALDAANRAMELRMSAGAGPLPMADSYNSLGVVLTAVGRAKEAKDLLLRSLELRQSSNADTDEIAVTLHNLGLAQSGNGDFASAIESISRALSLRAAKGGSRSHRTAYQVTLASYGTVLGRAGRTQDALAVLQQNLAQVQELHGDDVEATAIAHNELGSVLQDAGQFDEAIGHYRESLRINRAINGSESANAAKPLNNMASAYEDSGDYRTAIALFRESLAIRGTALPATDPMVARAEYNLARALVRGGDRVEGSRLLDKVLAGYRNSPAKSEAAILRARLLDVEARLQGKDASGAEALLRLLHADASQFSAQQRAQAAELEGRLARLKNDSNGELRDLKQAWDLQVQVSGRDHPYATRRAIAYAVALADAGHHDSARDVAASAASTARSAFASDIELMRTLDRLAAPSPR